MSSGGSGWDPTQSGRPDEGKEEGQEGGAPPPVDPEGDPGSGWSTTTVWKVQKQGAPFIEEWKDIATITGKSEASTLNAFKSRYFDPYFDYRLVRSDGQAVLAYVYHTKEKEPTKPPQPGAAGDGTTFDWGSFQLFIPEWVWGLMVFSAVMAVIYVIVKSSSIPEVVPVPTVPPVPGA